MRAAVNHDDAPGAESGWLTGCATDGIPGDHRRRHARAGAPHPRRGRDARRDLPGAMSPARGAASDRRRAEHGRPRPRPRGDDRRAAHASRARATARGSSRSTPGSSARSSATSPARRDARALSRARRRPRSCWRPTPTASSSSRPRRPGGARTTSSTRSASCCGKKPVFGICLGHQLLSRAVGPGDLQAAVRPPRRQPPGQGPAHRPDRDHGPEPRLRGRGRARRGPADRLRRRRSSPT